MRIKIADRRFVVSLVLLALLLVPWGVEVSAQSDQQLQVTIIAVTDFEDNALAGGGLVGSVKAATSELVNFFASKYGVAPRVFSSHDDTTANALRRWLFRDLSRNTQQSIHLVFVLSHGIGDQYVGETPFKNELFIATSDTRSDDYWGTAIRGSELIDALERLSAGSSAFLFLDTCGSGSIYNSGILARLQGDGRDATHFMILASSMAEENAFRARFTKALVNIWSSPDPPPNDCHYGESRIEEFVTSRMQALDFLAPQFKQSVRLIYPFTGEFCIESFGSSTALAILANPTKEELQADIKSVADPANIISLRVSAESVRPVVLRRRSYSVDVQPTFPTSALAVASFTMDLSSPDYVQYRPLYQGEPIADAMMRSQAVKAAASFGAPPSVVSALHDAAKAELSTAFATLSQQAAHIASEITTQEAAVNAAQSRQLDAEQRVQTAEAALSKALQSQSAFGPFAVGIQVQAPAVDDARAVLVNAQAKAATLTRDHAEATRKLSSYRDSKIAIEARRRDLSVIAAASADPQETAAQKATRAKLLDALKSIAQTQDDLRGLTITLPDAARPPQLKAIASLLASMKEPLLIEIEVHAYGHQLQQNQEIATKRAEMIRRQLVKSASSLAPWIVVRGFPALPDSQHAENSSLTSIIVSGAFIGASPPGN